jgi:DNA-binding CsgD family transcriptional regulator
MFSGAEVRFLREVCGAISQAAQESYTVGYVARILAEAFGLQIVTVRDRRKNERGEWVEHFSAEYPAGGGAALAGWEGDGSAVCCEKDRVAVRQEVGDGQVLTVVAGLAKEKLAMLTEACAQLAGELGRRREWETEGRWQVAEALSRREMNVVRAVMHFPALSEKLIAQKIGLSVHTVHTHLRTAYRKANVRSRGELATMIQMRRHEARVAALREMGRAGRAENSAER